MDKLRTEKLTTDVFDDVREPEQIVRGLGLRVDADVILKVVEALRTETPLYRLYASGKQGRVRQCAKATAYKIKGL